MSRTGTPAFETTLTLSLQAVVAAHGWAPGHYLPHCIDCSPERNARHTRGDFRTAAPQSTRCREHALEAALRDAHQAASRQARVIEAQAKVFDLQGAPDAAVALRNGVATLAAIDAAREIACAAGQEGTS